jgi:hypothetical protein
MKALRMAVMTGMLVGVAGCSRQAPAVSAAAAPSAPHPAADATATYAYLEAVGRARAQVNSDNKERIPALISSQDVGSLGTEAATMAHDRQDLDKLSTDTVDPDAVQFARNFEAILAAYESVCTDSAQLFTEAARADDQKPGSSSLMGVFRGSLTTPKADAIGAAGALVDIGDRAADAAKPAELAITPIVQKLREDRDRLVAAKEAHHAFALKVRADFAQRYPNTDWSAKEVLPP